MKTLTLTLLFSSILLLGFTFFLMSYEGGHTGCLAERAMGTACPVGGLSFIAFHVQAFKDVSIALATIPFILALFLLALGSAALSFLYASSLNRFIRRVRDTVVHFSHAAVYEWLALHEESPSYVPART